jgi:hypothetical protein
LHALLSFQVDNKSWHTACFLQAGQLPSDWLEKDCVEPPKADMPLVILWGDSHAAHLRPGLDALPEREHFRLGEMTAAGCGPYLNWATVGRPHCREDNKTFLNEIGRLKPNTVIVAAWWNQNGIGPIRQSIHTLKLLGVPNIVIVGPVPQWAKNLPELLAQKAMLNDFEPPNTLPFNTQYVQRNLDEDLLKIARSEGVEYVSPLQTLCPNDSCITMLGQLPQDVTQSDYTHLTDVGSKFFVQRNQHRLLPGL